MRYFLISTIPKTLLALFVLLFFSQIKKSSAEEYSVPHFGSPYLSLNELSNNEILHLPTGLKVNFNQMQDVISSSKVIYIGETHDNTEAHRVQLKIIEDLAQRFPGKRYRWEWKCFAVLPRRILIAGVKGNCL